MKFDGISPLKEKAKDHCIGLWWRGRVRTYVSAKGSVVTEKSMTLLKRRSCTGCSKCDWIEGFLVDDVAEEQRDYLPDIKHNALYTCEPEISEDWESGEINVEAMNFVEGASECQKKNPNTKSG